MVVLGIEAALMGATITSTASGGNWNATTSWVGGAVPASTDDVVIANAATVTVTTNQTCNSCTVGQGTSGTLSMGATSGARTLTITTFLTLAAGSTVQTNAKSGNEIDIGTNLTNNGGNLNLFTSATVYTNLLFNGSSNGTISDSGTPTYNLTIVTFNKGTSTATVDNKSTAFWTTLNTWTAGTAVVFTQGVYIHDNTATWDLTRNYSGATVTISAGATIRVSQGTVNMFIGSGGSPGTLAVVGTLDIEGGTLNMGNAANEAVDFTTNGASLTVGSGALNVSGPILNNSSTISWNYNQSGGAVTTVTVGQTNAGFAGFEMINASSSFTMSGGTLTFQNSANNSSDFWVKAGTSSVTGGTVIFGNASTPSATTFGIDSTVPVYNLSVVGASGQATKPTLQLVTDSITVKNTVTIGTSTVTATLNSNSLDFTVGGDWLNYGTFTQGIRTVTFNGSVLQTIGGTTGTTFYNLTLNNTSGLTPAVQFGDGTTGSLTFTASNIFTWTAGNIRVGQGALTDKLNVSQASTTAPASSNLTTVGSASTVNFGGSTGASGIYINTGGTLSMGTTSTISDAGDWTNSGTFTASTSTVTLNGSVLQTVGGTAATTFYNLTLNNTSGLTPAIQIGDGTTGSLTFTASNTFTWTAGNIRVGQGALTDKLNLTLAAATVTTPASSNLTTIGSASVFNVGGSAGASGVYINTGTLSMGTTSTISDAGNWTNAGTFTASTSTVTLNGSVLQTVGGTAATTFNNLTLNNTSGASPAIQFGDGTTGSLKFAASSALTWTAGNVQVGQGALGDTLDFQPTSTTLTIPSGISLTLNAASRLSLGSGDTLTVTGTLATINTSAGSTAGVSTDAGYCAVNLNGTANISYLNWDGLQSTGVVVGSTATLIGWNNITFASSQGGANSLYLDLSACTNTTALPNTMNACWFSAGTQFNVKGNGTRTDVTKKLYFINYGGPMAGESLETGDSIDWIRWGGGVVLRNGTSDVATYGSIQDAVNAATATNYWIEVRDNVIRNESINLSTFNFTGFTNGLVIEGAVMSPSSTGPSIIGSGNTGNEILQNCVFLRPSGSSRVLVQDVGRMIHCDLLGNPADGTLATFGTNGSAYQLWACIVGYPGPPGSPNAWPSASPVLTQTAGTLTVSYCDLGGAVSGTYSAVSPLASSDPLLVNYVPGDGIATGKGIYDVHLQSTSPCIDKAPVPAAPFVNVTTDLNRGTDISDPSVNTHVPPYAGNPDRPIYALSDPNHTSTTPYDVGAVEYGPGTIGSPAKPQSLPLWTRQTGPSLGATGGSVTDMIPTYDFATYALIVGDNISTTSQKVHALDMNSGNEVTGVTPYDLYASVSTTITHIFRISVVKDAGATDSVYCVVNTTGDTSGGPNAIVALTYNGSAFSPKSGWTNPVMGSTGSGRLGMVVVDSSGNIAFVKGRRLYYLNGSSGAAMTGTYWAAADGHEKASSQGAASDDIFDAEGAPFIDVSATNNIIQVPLAGHPTDQVWRIQLSDGSKTAAKQAVVQTYEINDAGFNQIGGRIYVTPSQSDFVVALNHINFTNVWTSDNLLANVTSRAQTFLRSDGDVRVVVRNTVFRIAKSTGNGLNGGNVALDSATSGSHDWGTSNPMRGDITTSPFIVGSRGVGLTNGRTGAQMFFGTNLGMCYVLSYIRNTTGNYAVDNDNQPADSGSVMLVTDGKPYPGFPYRIMGGKADGTAWSQVGIQSVTLGYSSTYGVNLLIFAVDNGWIYAFPEPY